MTTTSWIGSALLRDSSGRTPERSEIVKVQRQVRMVQGNPAKLMIVNLTGSGFLTC